MRILLVVNTHARRGKEPIDAALGIFERAGMSVAIETARKGRDAPNLIERRAAEVDAIVLAGGDGTVHEAAPALVAAGLPIGILPRGTANDLARAINLPLDLAKAAEVIVAGATRRIDVGEVNGTLFFNVAHIGLGAALADALTPAMKQRFGPFAYTVAAGRALSGLRPFRVEIVAGEQRLTMRTFGVTVGNGRYFGGTGMVAEDAEIDDGVLHLFALKTKNPFRLALLIPQIAQGRQGRSNWVETIVAPQIEVGTLRPMKIRADGKIVSEAPASFRVHAGALTVFAPAKPERP